MQHSNVHDDRTHFITSDEINLREQGSVSEGNSSCGGDQPPSAEQSSGRGVGSPMNSHGDADGSTASAAVAAVGAGGGVSDSDAGVVERCTSAGAGSRASGTTASMISTGAPTTTISTIAVQSGTTRVVLALLQVSSSGTSLGNK